MDAKNDLLANPTRGYRPGIGLATAGLALAVADGIPPFTWMDVPRMVRDPQVQFALKMWRSPFQQVKWRVKCKNPRVAKFVDASLRRLWQKSLPKLLDRYCKFGHGVGAVEFCERRGLVRVDRLQVVEPGDAQPRVWKAGPKAGRFAGFALRTDTGQRWASPAHAVWFAGQGEYGPFYDRAVMAGAFLPWVEKRGRNGAIHSRQQWFRKCSFSGGVMRHPDGQINTGTEESPRLVDAQDYAREMLDCMEAGSVLTLSNALNPGEPGKYEWEYTPAESRSDVAGVREYPQDLDKEILAGFGIPGEVLEASEVGSGWSGRAVPLKAYYGSVDELVGPLIEALDGPIRYAVRANFGEQWYEVEPVSLVEQLEQAGKGQGGGEQGGGDGGNPPQQGGGGRVDKHGHVFDESRHRYVRPENLGVSVHAMSTWDESKHARNHGKFAKKSGPREGKPSKRLTKAADARAAEHLRHAAAARKAGDTAKARAHAKAAYGHNLAALRHSEGRHAAAVAVARRADEFVPVAKKPAELRPNADLDAAFADPAPAPAPKPAAPLRHNPDLDAAFGEPKPLPVAKRLPDASPLEPRVAIPPRARAWAKSQADANAATVAKHFGADPARAKELLHAAIHDAIRKAIVDGSGTAVILAPDGSGKRIRVHVRRKKSVSLSRDGDAVPRFKLRMAALPPRKPPSVGLDLSDGRGDPLHRHPSKLVALAMVTAALQAARKGRPGAAAELIDLLSQVSPEEVQRVLGPRSLSWVSYEGPRGGRGWKNTESGRVIYGAGRAKPGEKREKAQASAKRAGELVSHVTGNAATPEHLQELADHLPALDVRSLQLARRRLGASFGGNRRRDAMVNALLAHVTALKKGEAPPKNPLTGAALKSAKRPDGTPHAPANHDVHTVPVASLKTDPARFQYKVSGIGKEGVGQELKGVQTWNPELGGALLVWRDPADGRDYVINGHHRHELASRLGAKDMNVRYIDAANAKEARSRGALANIAEGRGTAVDAAKYLRDSRQTVDHLRKAGISLSGRVAADAAVLTNLNDAAFQRVADGRLDEAKAVAVAKHLQDPVLQEKLFKKLDEREEEGKDWSNREIETAARKLARAGKVTEQGQDLFGGFEDEKSTWEQEVELEAMIGRKLAEQVGDYKAVSNAKRAERVADAGNQKRRLSAEQEQETFRVLSDKVGPVAEAIKASAADLAVAKTKKEKDRVRAGALERVRQAIAGELAPRKPVAADAGGGGTGGGGDPRPAEPAAPGAGEGVEKPLRDPYYGPNAQLDMFGGEHRTPRPAKPAVQESLIPREVEQAENVRRTEDALNGFKAASGNDPALDMAGLDDFKGDGPDRGPLPRVHGQEELAKADAARRVRRSGSRNSVGVPVPDLTRAAPHDVTNAIDRSASPDEKVRQLKALTAENKPKVDEFLKGLDAKFGTRSVSNEKKAESILAKARRPGTLAQKPWHDVEHVRDSFRFKTVIDDVRKLPEIIAHLEQNLGAKVIKRDVDKFTNPGPWGWRIAAFDLQMPNGQLVEYYTPLHEMNEANAGGNHKLFEKWRNEDPEKLSADQLKEFHADLKTSRERYQAAYDKALDRSGATESEVRAALASLTASAAGTAKKSS